MTLYVGDQLPEATFYVLGENGPETRTTSEIFKGKKIVLFAVPGAFTGTCHNHHLPGYVEHADDIRSKGIDDIMVTSVNDIFVMDGWLGISGAQDKVNFISDPYAEFAKALGLEIDIAPASLGVRSKRYSMIVEDGTVTTFNLEDNPGQAIQSAADKILEAL